MRFTTWASGAALNVAAALAPLLPVQHRSAAAWVPLVGSGAIVCAIVAVPLVLSYHREVALRTRYLANNQSLAR